MGRPRLLCCALALAVGLLATGAAALYEKNGPVLQLTPRSFDKVLKSKVPVVVEFFAPWCGHCKQLAPAFNQAASTLAGIVPFVAIDCDRDTNRPLCSQYGVQGFPTIKIFSPGSKTPTDYQGERSAKALANAAVGQLTSKHVKKVTSLQEAIMFLSSPTTKVVLVTEKRRTSAMYKSLAQRFASHASLEFAEVVKDSESAALLAQYGVTKAPTLLAITADRQTLTYNGEMKAPKIMTWLKEVSAGAASAAKAAAEAGKAAKEAPEAAEAARAAEEAWKAAEAAASSGGASDEQPAETPKQPEAAPEQEIPAGAASAAKAARDAVKAAKAAAKAAAEADKAAEEAMQAAEAAASSRAASGEQPAAEKAETPKQQEAPKPQAPKEEAPKQQEPQPEQNQAEETQRKTAEDKPAAPEVPQVVANLTTGELARRLEKEGVVVLAFYAGSGEGACRESLNKLNVAVAGLHNMAQGVQVDVSAPKEAAEVKAQWGIDLPVAGSDGSCDLKIFLLPFDPEDHEDSDEWKAYAGGLSTKELHKAALELFPTVGITPVTAETYPHWVSTDPTRVRVMLFTDKAEPPPLFRALSSNFRQFRMDFGFVHSSDAKLVAQLQVKKVPALVASYPGPPAVDGSAQLSASPYSGPMRYGNMAGWLTMLALQLGVAPEEVLQQFGVGAANKDAKVAQITDQNSWQDSCLGKGGVCIVAAMSRGAADQQKQLDVLRAAAEGRAEQPLYFCWFEAAPAGASQQFAARLGLDAGQAPALVAVAPKKERSAIMTGRFEKDSISNWLDGLLSGKVRTAPMQQLPEFPAADGVGADEATEEAPVEEEFDLSDIMNEEIEGDLSKAKKDEL